MTKDQTSAILYILCILGNISLGLSLTALSPPLLAVHGGRGDQDTIFKKLWMLLVLHQTKKNQQTESNENKTFGNHPTNQTIPSWPKYVMAKSTNKNIPLMKLSPFKLAKFWGGTLHSVPPGPKF